MLLQPALAPAQTRAGGEFQVNTYTTGYQFLPAVGMDKAGNFVIVWGGEQPGSLTDALAQRYTAAGVRVGGEFRVNSYTTGFQTYVNITGTLRLPPSVSRSARGDFVVAWSSYPGPVNQFDVVGQRFDATGAPRGAEFVVTAAGGYRADVAIAPSGAFVVAFNAYDASGGDSIFVRRYDSAGAPIGAQFQVNTYTTGYQSYASVAMAPDGGFVVVWHDFSQDGQAGGVFGRRFSGAGTPLGGEFRVNTYTTNDQLRPQVATDALGNFVVVWSSAGQFSPADVVGQRYDAAGNALGAEFLVNSFTIGYQLYASVARNAPGDFIVSWLGQAIGDVDGGVFARRFNADGSARDVDFLVNSYTTGLQALPEVTTDGAGNFVVAWTNVEPQDGSSTGAFAQRFGGIHPAVLRVDTPGGGGADGNNVLEPGEAVDVRPSWRNTNGSAQTLAATVANFTGPAASGVVYEVHDAAGAYGTVANGATAECADCYHVGVLFGGTRPAQHWDGTTDESMTGNAQGQRKRWTLHVGESFSDAPRSSPFYRFIETLLHNGVTGGCSATAYCPATSTTREQMAPFVLMAKEGSGYLPPACATPVFADVPASSPFCRWIEELARRGVVPEGDTWVVK